MPLSDITAGKESEFLQQLTQHSTAEAASRYTIYHMHGPVFISSLLHPSPVILSSNMSAEQAVASIPEESKEVELGPLPTVEGKSEDEVKELLTKAAKQGMFDSISQIQRRMNFDLQLTCPNFSPILLLRLQLARRQVLLLPHLLQCRGMGPHQDHQHFQANEGLPVSWSSVRCLRFAFIHQGGW